MLKAYDLVANSHAKVNIKDTKESCKHIWIFPLFYAWYKNKTKKLLAIMVYSVSAKCHAMIERSRQRPKAFWIMHQALASWQDHKLLAESATKIVLKAVLFMLKDFKPCTEPEMMNRSRSIPCLDLYQNILASFLSTRQEAWQQGHLRIACWYNQSKILTTKRRGLS